MFEHPPSSFFSSAYARERIDQTQASRRIGHERGGEVDLVGGPCRNQALRVRNARSRVLNHVALDTAVITVAVRGVAATREVNRDHAVTPKNVRTKCRAGRGLVRTRHGHEVGLEEIHTRARQFEHFREVRGRKIFHLHQTFRRVLQDIHRAVVARIVNGIAPREGVDDTCETLFTFDKRLHRTAGQRLHLRANDADRDRGEGSRRRGRKLHERAGVNGRGAVSLVTDKRGERLAKAVRHFLSDVLYRVVDRRDHRETGERRVIRVFANRRGAGHERGRNTVTRVAFIRLRGVRAERIVLKEDQLVTTVNREIPTFRATDEGRLSLQVLDKILQLCVLAIYVTIGALCMSPCSSDSIFTSLEMFSVLASGDSRLFKDEQRRASSWRF